MSVRFGLDANGYPCLRSPHSSSDGIAASRESAPVKQRAGKAMTLAEVAGLFRVDAEEAAELLQKAEIPRLVAFARRDVLELRDGIRSGRVHLKRKGEAR